MSDKIAISLALIAAASVFIGGACIFIFYTLIDITRELRRFNDREEKKP